ncbi:MAG: SpoIIE family protein phosphatase [Bacteroidota bacterium]|nr:SpoIIE family protein phosphatase [Bacteroidota bacterium]
MSENLQTTPVDWKSELNATAFKFHSLIAWVAVFLNPIWVIGDYFTIPEHFNDFLIFRIAVSVATLLVLIYRKKLANTPELIALIPFIGISIQNAYMYSVMDIPELQKHTFAYIALFIGAGMFVLWRPWYSVAIVVISFIANVVFFKINSHLSVGQILINGGMLTASVAIFTILLIHTRTNLTKREIVSRLALAESNSELEIKNEIIEEKNKDIRDSINYAQRIQQAILPADEKISSDIKDYFILYKPKDIISGDFYWHTNVTTTAEGKPSENIVVMAAVDCTGHGVPGALMSIIGSTVLNQTSSNVNVNSPADALGFLNDEITKTLNSIKDGMDISLCAINFSKPELQYAGANNPLWIIRKGELIEIKPDKQAIGADTDSGDKKVFTNHVIPLEKGDAVYLFTDGYADQFGGPFGKKLKYRQFQNTLLEIQSESMADQKQILDQLHLKWKGELEQVDDILVIGIRI